MNIGDETSGNLPDHRRLGQELDLFVFSELIGSGLPLFTPRGTVVRDELIKFSEELQVGRGYKKVSIPHITKEDLYKTSGHWDKFGDELFLVKSQETKDQMVLKPMNCPHHIEIYASRPRSYKELPIRYMDSAVVYRDEKKGELNGLSRVRSITIDDAHIFCTFDQIEQEFTAIMEMIKQMYGVFDMQFKARLSFRDNSDEYLGDKEDWDRAQQIIEDVAKRLNLEYTVAEGDAAFYGPKIDILVMDSLGREWQCATEQLDFVMPKRFKLAYLNSDGTEKTPVIIHKALLGSVERFLSVYLEHTNGSLPLWLAPEQLRIITLNNEEEVIRKANELVKKAHEQMIRTGMDDSNESVGKKIRNAELMKIPYAVVIGEKEVKTGQLFPRRSGQAEETTPVSIEDFIEKLAQHTKSRK
jgi:threonyl-tRNA synthetase